MTRRRTVIRWSRSIAVVGLVVGLLPALNARLAADDDALLKAIQNGTLSFGNTMIAVPAPSSGDAAPPAPGSGLLPAHPLYAINKAEEKTISEKAYPLMSSKWPFNVVFVCWENPSPQNEAERRWVQSAIEDTWEKNSTLRFLSWQKCSAASTGIRILVEDSGPHVKFLGKYLDGKVNGMVLNFTFNNWSESCRTTREYCIRVIGVHEFGHAIGFAHEQNRPDTAGDCALMRQGSDGDLLLTPWDPNSVMNYCNSKYNNDGQLSILDIKAVQYIYGAPSK
jgi:hypothetical protein